MVARQTVDVLYPKMEKAGQGSQVEPVDCREYLAEHWRRSRKRMVIGRVGVMVWSMIGTRAEPPKQPAGRDVRRACEGAAAAAAPACAEQSRAEAALLP